MALVSLAKIQMSDMQRYLNNLVNLRAPVSLALLSMLIGSAVMFLLNPKGSGLLAFDPVLALHRPWTLLTYAFSEMTPPAAVFSGLGLYFFGIELERHWPQQRYLRLIALSWLSTPVAVWVCLEIFGRAPVVSSFGWLVAHVIIAWSVNHRYSNAILLGLIRLPAPFWGFCSGVLSVVVLSRTVPFAAPLFALPFLGTWWFAGGRVSLRLPSKTKPSRTTRKTDYEGIDQGKKRQAETERRKLKELFERSWGENDGPEDP